MFLLADEEFFGCCSCKATANKSTADHLLLPIASNSMTCRGLLQQGREAEAVTLLSRACELCNQQPRCGALQKGGSLGGTLCGELQAVVTARARAVQAAVIAGSGELQSVVTAGTGCCDCSRLGAAGCDDCRETAASWLLVGG